MKDLQEWRDPGRVRALAREIREVVTRPWRLMEICGGQTHSIMRYGLDRLLPREVELIHGPGCPVCVTPLEAIDQALELASRPGLLFASYGDMLRVPGSRDSLQQVKARGGDVRVVYSPLDAVRLARENPHREVVFFAIGFETTAPANAMAVEQARRLGLQNFSVLVSHVLVPPAIEALLADPDCRVQGFLAAGHVCTVMGLEAYRPLAERFRVPIVVTGFEPVDLLKGIRDCLLELEAGRHRVLNPYARVARAQGNPAARALLEKVFRCEDRAWRGIGVIPKSGWGLSEAYAAFDARRRFTLRTGPAPEPPACRAGEVMQGRLKPPACAAFGGSCTPEHPLGAPMVSAEGACSAWYRYRRAAGEECA